MQPLILTNVGLAKLASATPEDQLEIKHIAVGDGGGGYPPIDPTMTALVNEVWRGDSSAPIRDPESNRVLIFETIIPNNEGGFTIREVGLFDVDGDMIAIGQIDEIEKTDGSPGTTPVMLTLRVRLTLENASQTDLIIADAPYIDHQGTSNRDASDAHPIEAITGLRGELDAKANTSDLGTAAYKDLITGWLQQTPGLVVTTDWRGGNLGAKWQALGGAFLSSQGWVRIATINHRAAVQYGTVGEIRVTGIDAYPPISNLNPTPASANIVFYRGVSEPRIVSYISGNPSDSIGQVWYVEDDSNPGLYDLYIKVGGLARPVCEYFGGIGTIHSLHSEAVVTELPPGAVQALAAYDWNSLSMAQTWQDMTASRALGTDYVNNTGRPIHVSVAVNRAAGSTAAYADLRVDGQVVSQFKASSDTGQVYGPLYAIVPPGATYRATTSGASTDSAVLFRWSEYR